MSKSTRLSLLMSMVYFLLMAFTLAIYLNSDLMQPKLGMIQPTFALYAVAIFMQNLFGILSMYYFEESWISIKQLIMSMITYVLITFIVFSIRLYPLISLFIFLMAIPPLILLVFKGFTKTKKISKSYVSLVLQLSFLLSLLFPPSFYLANRTYELSLFQNPIESGLSRDEYFELYKDELSLLRIESWKTCSEGCRLQVMQLVENIEAAIAHRPAIQIESILMQPDIYGHFSYVNAQIAVNESLLHERHAQHLLHTVLHEGRHVYQYIQVYDSKVKHEDPMLLQIWQDNLQSYKHISNYSYDDYVNQAVEVDAENFALEVIFDYCKRFSTISAQCDAYVKRGIYP